MRHLPRLHTLRGVRNAMPAGGVPARAVPARPVLARAVPARAVLIRAVPARPVLARAVPARPVLARAVPAGPVLARAVPARAVPTRPVLIRTVLIRTVLIRTVLAGTVLAGAGLVATGCGSGQPATFHPAGVIASGASPAPVSAKSQRRGPEGMEWPPFGRNVHIVMPEWLPAYPSQVPAVIAAKNFLLAYLYAEYRGNQDHRWTAYASGKVVASLKATLGQPDVTSQSFAGTIRFSQMRAFPDPVAPSAVDVSECFDNSHSANTDLVTGKVISDNTPPDQHYYRNTDVLAKGKNGRWHVVSVYPTIYYPQAKECKP
jgi:hypothetical protein